jgi:hypothetical protein
LLSTLKLRPQLSTGQTKAWNNSQPIFQIGRERYTHVSPQYDC